MQGPVALTDRGLGQAHYCAFHPCVAACLGGDATNPNGGILIFVVIPHGRHDLLERPPYLHGLDVLF